MVGLSTKESRFCFDLLPITSQTAFFTIAWHSDQRRTLPRLAGIISALYTAFAFLRSWGLNQPSLAICARARPSRSITSWAISSSAAARTTRHAIIESRFRHSPGLSGQALETLRYAAIIPWYSTISSGRVWRRKSGGSRNRAITNYQQLVAP